MNFEIPIRAEVKAKAGSRYDVDTIMRRLAAIESDASDKADRERQFLKGLLAKQQLSK